MDMIEKVMNAMCNNASFIIEKLGKDCCIAATKLALDVLASFQIDAEPVVVQASAWNDKFTAKVDREKRLPQNEQERREFWAEGGYSIGCGFGIHTLKNGQRVPGVAKGKWAGHLVVAVGSENKYLLDLTIGQISRPQYGIRLDPFWGEMSNSFPYEQEKSIYQICQKDRGDALLIYQSRPGDESYNKTPDWVTHSYYKSGMVDTMTRVVSKCLKHNSP